MPSDEESGDEPIQEEFLRWEAFFFKRFLTWDYQPVTREPGTPEGGLGKGAGAGQQGAADLGPATKRETKVCTTKYITGVPDIILL